MLKLLKSAEVYSPRFMGRKDILLVLDKIAMIEDSIATDGLPMLEVIDCTGKIACPGIIDQHVHIIGGGGEEGPPSSIPELMLGDIISGGISTVVGVLGLDASGKTMQALLRKARSLEYEGLNTFIYTGYYGVPAVTVTGSILTDIVLIDKIIGAGEIAISDYRSSHPSLQMLKQLASEAITGGMVGGKAGVLHIHTGDGKKGLGPLIELLDDSDYPMKMFVPTHLNRNRRLFNEAKAYAFRGGNVDLTAGEKTGPGVSVADAVKELLEAGIPMEHITVSSDGNGSMKVDGNGGNTGVGSVRQLLADMASCILEKGVPFETAISLVTENVAKVLSLFPAKGRLAPGSDADVLILNRADLTPDKLIVKGSLLVDNGVPLKKGRFEK